MDHYRLNRLSETDFNTVFTESGGGRAVPDHSRETERNADYALHEAVAELKLFEEEGLEKETRRRKVAEIFRGDQPDRPVVVIDPARLGDDARRRYYNAMEGPIKTQVKSAAQQLHATRERLGGNRVRVLLAINNGYTALNHQEFSRTVVKCATNDTEKIDYVVTGGVYYYSDAFDNYFIAPFELFPVRDAPPFLSFDRLRECYQAEIERQMTAMILGPSPAADTKLPVVDLAYELDGIRYVKPAPPMGVPSSFYVNGRPRENSTGITRGPVVATTFPKCTLREWERIRADLADPDELRDSYAAWQAWSDREAACAHRTLKPFVTVDVTSEAFGEWCAETFHEHTFHTLCKFAEGQFNARVREIALSAQGAGDSHIVRLRYMLLTTEEIGQDKANDLSSLRFVSETPGCEREETIFENERIFHEHGVALAAAYAIRDGVETVLYEIDKTYCWS